MKHLTFTLLFLCSSLLVMAQESTYDYVYNVIQTKCKSCHSGSSPAGKLALDMDKEALYEHLLSVEPTNPYAKEQGFKMLDPGYPDRSFLFRKCNNDLYATAERANAEGGLMPAYGGEPLTKTEQEMIRQWILFDRSNTEQVVDPDVVERFYNGEGQARVERPPVPDPSEGFQLYMGTIFLEPQEEIEVHKRQDLRIPDSVEVKRIELFMNESSHHCAIFKFNPGSAENFPAGAKVIGSLVDQYDYFFETSFVLNSQFAHYQLELPPSTAFIWEGGTELSLNYHIRNYSETGILPAEFYINVYTQPKGTAKYAMKSETINFGGNNPLSLRIKNNATDSTFVIDHFQEENAETRYYWAFQGHTHKYGIDYDIFHRNVDGTKGDQIYEGFYNADHTVNQGYFDFEHPPLLLVNPLLEIDMAEGLLFEATFNNYGDETVLFGLTTADEMFAGYLMYTDGPVNTVGVEEELMAPSLFEVLVHPNPVVNDWIEVSYQLPSSEQVQINLYDVQGKLIQVVPPLLVGSGSQKQQLSVEHLVPGIYFLEVSSAEGSETVKVIIE